MFKAIQTKLSEFEELSAVAGANNVLMKYINDKISELDAARQTLQEELLAETVTDTTGKVKQITIHVDKWDSLSFEDKQAVVDTLVKIICII